MLGVAAHPDTSRAILARLLRVVEATHAQHEPFSHIYLENLFPEDIYAEMMASMPDPPTIKPSTSISILARTASARATYCHWIRIV